MELASSIPRVYAVVVFAIVFMVYLSWGGNRADLAPIGHSVEFPDSPASVLQGLSSNTEASHRSLDEVTLSETPSTSPTTSLPSVAPSLSPRTANPSTGPSNSPSKAPTSSEPTSSPSLSPTISPTTLKPTNAPSTSPVTERPSATPTTSKPSTSPSRTPVTSTPSVNPTSPQPTTLPSYAPSTSRPTLPPTSHPSSVSPSASPSLAPITSKPSLSPSPSPTTVAPSQAPTTSSPSPAPTTTAPSRHPTTSHPSRAPTTLRFLPNILIMLTDDLDYSDVGYNGGFALTPRLNALVSSQNAIKLERLYSPSSVCSPTRLALLSGRVPERDCVPRALLDNTGVQYRLGTHSIVSIAKQVGYRTAFFGKWHLTKTPWYLGFDDWVYSPSSVPTYDPACFCLERRCMNSCKFSRSLCVRSGFKRCSSRTTKRECDMGHLKLTKHLGFTNWGCDMFEGGSPAQQTKTVQFPRYAIPSEYLAGRFASYADEHLNASHQPFYIQISFQEAHRPFIASPSWRQLCFNGTACRGMTMSNSILTNYYGVVAALDQSIGIVVDKLESIGRLNNTLILFASDNAGETTSTGGVLEMIPHRPFRGTKRLVYEGGIRIPGFIHWQGVITQNAVVSEPTTLLDFAPTFLDIIHPHFPSLMVISPVDEMDGESWLPMIMKPGEWARNGSFGICQPVSHLTNVVCERYAFVSGRFKLITRRYRPGVPEIYDISRDPGERINLAGNNTLRRALQAGGESWIRKVYSQYYDNCVPKRPRRPGQG